MNVEHKYVLEDDVIRDAGEIALQQIGEEGNIIYLDLPAIEQKSEDERNKHRFAFQEVVKHIEKNGTYDPENKTIHLKSGGVISWADPYNSKISGNGGDLPIKHITRSPGISSRLKRKGRITEFPQVLVFGTDTLSRGLRDVYYNGPNPKDLTLDQLLIEGFEYDGKGNQVDILEETLRNFQYFRLNDNDDLTFQLLYSLKSNDRKTRFRINEDKEPSLLRVDANNWGETIIPNFKPRNLRQKLCFRNFTHENIETHIISGGSGSGKTILPYAGAIMHLLGNEKQRKRGEIKDSITLFKSTSKIADDDEGYLPGTSFEKNWPFMKSYKKAHDLLGLYEIVSFEDLLADPRERKQNNLPKGMYLPSRTPAITTPNLMYERGETYEKEVVLVDEAQNYTPYQMKQLIERVGEQSTLFIVGDYDQIDNPKLSPEFNGLVYAANVLDSNLPTLGMMNFDENYRSQVAEVMRAHKAPRD